MRPIRTFAAGATYVLAYVCLTLLLPTQPSARRPLIALPLMAVPAIAALLLSARAARTSHGAERTFWKLFVLAVGAHLVSQVSFLLQALRVPSTSLPIVAGHLGYYGFAVLSMVALIVRPHRPRTSRVATTAAVEWIMALAGFYFLFFYFVLVPVGGAGRTGHAVFSLQEVLPAAAAIFLALTTRASPFRSVYRPLAAGFGGALALNAVANWVGTRGGGWIFTPRDAVWMLPFVGIAAAATAPRGPFWAGVTTPPGRSRGWLAASAIMLPPVLDLSARALGWQPELAAARSQTTLVAVILMSLLLAWRLREAPSDTLSPTELADGPAARAARTAHLAFAAGVSHELNNPLMAVAGWAEVVQSRGEAHASVGRLLEAARSAADAVGRLQRVVGAGVADPARPAGDE
jgi:signal transduction histidine kinase